VRLFSIFRRNFFPCFPRHFVRLAGVYCVPHSWFLWRRRSSGRPSLRLRSLFFHYWPLRAAQLIAFTAPEPQSSHLAVRATLSCFVFFSSRLSFHSGNLIALKFLTSHFPPPGCTINVWRGRWRCFFFFPPSPSGFSAPDRCPA